MGARFYNQGQATCFMLFVSFGGIKDLTKVPKGKANV